MKFRDLEKIRLIIKEATGLNISYVYDDLVFPDNVVFIIQFDDSDNNNFLCHFRRDCPVHERKKIADNLNKVCQEYNCSFAVKGSFNMEQVHQELEIKFLKDENNEYS